MFYFIPAFIFAVIAGASRFIKDELSLEDIFNSSYLKRFESEWFGPKSITYNNKWREIKGIRAKAHGERFPGSSTVFAVFTDAWHFFAGLENMALILSGSFAVLAFQPTAVSFFASLLYLTLGIFFVKGTVFEAIERITTNLTKKS